MIRRLVDAHYEQFHLEANEDRVRFWLRESRSPGVLIRIGSEYSGIVQQEIGRRPLLAKLESASEKTLLQELENEQGLEKEADRKYWSPLKRELEQLRRERKPN